MRIIAHCSGINLRIAVNMRCEQAGPRADAFRNSIGRSNAGWNEIFSTHSPGAQDDTLNWKGLRNAVCNSTPSNRATDVCRSATDDHVRHFNYDRERRVPGTRTHGMDDFTVVAGFTWFGCMAFSLIGLGYHNRWPTRCLR